MDSLFILTAEGQIIIERHWKAKQSRTLADKFYEHVKVYLDKSQSITETPPVIALRQHYLIHIQRYGMYFVAVATKETQPTFVLELLDRVVYTIKRYLKVVSEKSIKQNFTIIYQLLDEMIDTGYPITTELSLLTDLVKPPTSIFKSLIQKSKGSGRSPVAWRKLGIKYTKNEIFFDIVEDLNCIVDVNGITLKSDVKGKILSNCRLSGMPDVLLSMKNSNVIKDCCFHPCVRYARYEQDNSLSFIPPDGEFELMSYKTGSIDALPIYCRPQINCFQGGGNLNIMLGAKGKSLDEVKVIIPFSEPVNTSKLSLSQGSLNYNSLKRELRWTLGKVAADSSPSLTGNFTVDPSAKTQKSISDGAVRVFFSVTPFAVSGLGIDKVDVKVSPNYTPFKGVRYVTQSGRCEFRNAGTQNG